MSFKFGGFGGNSGAGSGGGGLYAGISLDGKKTEEVPEEAVSALATAPNEGTAASAIPSGEADAARPEEKNAKGAGTWSASLRFAPVVRKQANKAGNAFRPTAFPSAKSTASSSTPAAAASTSNPLAFGDDADDDEPPAAPPSKGLHIPGRAKAALNAPVAGPAVDRSAQYSVFARSGGFLAAHAPERHPAHQPASVNAAPAKTAPPPPTSAPAEASRPGGVDAGIPGFKHSLPALLANTTTLSTLAPLASEKGTRQLRRKLDQLPPLTLPEEESNARRVTARKGDDVNGFAQSEEGKKLAQKNARGNKKKKGKKKEQEVDLHVYFAEDYDPARPNDYNEWITFLKDRRHERREAARRRRQEEEERRREEYDSGSYTSDSRDSDDERDRPAGRGRFFAPPTDYDAPPMPAQDDEKEAYAHQQPPSAPERAETGDDAYARRLAMSQARGPPPLSEPAAPAQSKEATGEEAYLRRLAMSSMQQQPSRPPAHQPPPPPTFKPAGRPVATDLMDEGPAAPANDAPYIETQEDVDATPAPPVNHAAMIADAQARARAIAERLAKAKGADPSTDAPLPPAPTDLQPPPPPPIAEDPTPPQAPALHSANAAILEAQARARAIAARLGSLGGAAQGDADAAAEAARVAEEQPNKAPGQADFARRLMDKYGWKEGQGLGANETGRTSILTVETNTPAKRRKGTGLDPEEPAPKRVGGLGGSTGKGRGMVLDEEKAERERVEKEKYGDPTKIVMLTNVVGPDEVDDDLADEIANEARKHGIVERCFVHLLRRPCEPHDAVRIFVLFSGLAGSWKTVKAFDGRFFGGRDVRARFFPEQAFAVGNFDAFLA